MHESHDLNSPLPHKRPPFPTDLGIFNSLSINTPPDLHSLLQTHPPAPGLKELLDRILAYYTKKGWDLQGILIPINALVLSEQTSEAITLLSLACQSREAAGKPLGCLLAGFFALTEEAHRQDLPLTEITPGHLLLYSKARDFIGQVPKGVTFPDYMVARDLCFMAMHEATKATVTLIKNEISEDALRLYYYFFHRSIFSKSNDLLDAFVNFCGVQPSKEHIKFVESVVKLLPSNYRKSHLDIDISQVITDISKALQIHFPIDKRTELSQEWEQYVKDWQSLLGGKHNIHNTPPLSNALMGKNPSPALLGLFLRTLELGWATPESHSRRFFLNPVMSTWRYLNLFPDTKLDSQLIRNLNQGIDKKTVVTPEQGATVLRRIVCHSLALSILDAKSLTERARDLDNLKTLTGAERFNFGSREHTHFTNSELTPSQDLGFYLWQRMIDMFHGFGALSIECRRPPSKDPPLLTRFGHDVGKVHYLNAKDIGLFPGRGFIIRDIKLESIFALNHQAAKTGRDPYHEYKTAWPDLADEFEDLQYTDFIFTRGMMVINSRNPDKYYLADETGRKTQFSYVLFNDHFHNPSSIVALMVPTTIIKNRLKGAFLGYEDYLGFDQSKPDINQLPLSPQELLEAGKALPIGTIDIGHAEFTLRGYNNAFVEAVTSYALLERQRKEIVDEWNRNPGRHYKPEDEILKRFRQLARELKALHDKLTNTTQDAATTQSPLTKLIIRYQNLFDLFRLALSYWHKGYVSPKGIDSRANPSFEQSGESSYNPNSLRMLIEAYARNAPRKDGVRDRKAFPILTIVDTLNYRHVPSSDFRLDTFDMSVILDGTKIHLPQDSDGRGVDEALFWSSHVMPRVVDSFKDFRFYERGSLGIL